MASTPCERTIARTAGLLLAAALLYARAALAQSHRAPFDSLLALDFGRDRVDLGTLRDLRPEELPLLRGVVFGRHGRVFRDEEIQSWLASQDWYQPDSAFTNAVLNERERTNLDLIRQVESEWHRMIEPGDLRWWQDRRMTEQALGSHTRTEWAVLRAEVEAVHGRRFDGDPWLQRYFEERYWYRADRGYDPGRLSNIERANLALIDSLSRAEGAGALVPCDMEPYEDRPVTVDLLRGSGFATLWILRNEIYARHGMTFRPRTLADWFAGLDWYEPRARIEVKLTPMEQRNVSTIAAYERALRDSLTPAPLAPVSLFGLFAEDAHRLVLEIYARHGRVFRRKWEQDYVASLPGYHPDPGYTDECLNEFERANIAAIVAYEKTVASVRDAVEG